VLPGLCRRNARGIARRGVDEDVWSTCVSCGGMWTGVHRLSKCTTKRVLADLFGLPMSLGTMSNLEAATTQAVAATRG